MVIQYEILDRPEVLVAIFHPRPEPGSGPDDETMVDHLIPVADDAHIGARFHIHTAVGANILFFHGNGEIVADYNELGIIFGKMGINLLAVDYRGYGRSTGEPSVSAMMADCRLIFEYVRSHLRQNGHTGPLVIMGRSLGSASALELAANYRDAIDALIIESGFAYAAPLLRLLGVDPDALGFSEADGFVNLEKIKRYGGPTLIIHAEYDHIIPYTEGLALYKASHAQDKSLLKIDGANHNDILLRGFDGYMRAIQRLVTGIRR